MLNELRLIFLRRRTLALLGVLGALPVLIGISIDLVGGPNAGNGPAFLAQVADNGVFLALAGLTVVTQFFLPLTVAIVAGDSIAGEASLGTLRYLLVRPVGRVRLLARKLAGALCYCLVASLVVVSTGLLAGVVLFPVGRVTTLSGLSVSLLDGVGRSLLAALVVGMSMFGLAGVGLFLSTLTEAPVGAMAATAGVFVGCLVAGSFPELSAIQPFLLTQHWEAFADLMRDPVQLSAVRQDILLQLAWGGIGWLAAWARCTTADVLA